ncbi:enoyl-CoA hydratase/isomerase family protein [Stutzerimonas stutzeri]|uniref:enoyl-CoA hydratase/isomerase family protein n=1 Tax=Stutzerimonas stutzeri TaxID=316 RepID=UPI002109FC13|nr:enoyl-CoA hydratase/isomerase family protein [Stutzerimonas stutzeri]MCQ4322480.1 enoyl-CoA hydratase/isomerase family protein [Stutzerimonas stutzeri]
MSEQEAVLLEQQGAALWITINRPEKRNAINHEVIARIGEGYRKAESDPAIRVIVLTAAGDKAFCAGGDLQPGQGFAFDYAKPNAEYADLLRLAVNATTPCIVRVNGVCMAGGMGLLCMGDMAVAHSYVKFGLPEVKVGLFPMQVLSLMQRLVPRRVLREWTLSGEPFTADEALQHGLLSHVVAPEELDAKVDWLIGRLTDKSPTAIRRGKYAMKAIEDMSFEQAIAYTETQLAAMALTEDAQEGMAAFNEKRVPNWPGR